MPCTKCKHKKCHKCKKNKPRGGALDEEKLSAGEQIEKYVRMTPWGAAIGAVTDVLIPEDKRKAEIYDPTPEEWRAEQFKKQHNRLTPDQVTWQLGHPDDSLYYQIALIQHGHPKDY